jgi:zinc protease
LRKTDQHGPQRFGFDTLEYRQGCELKRLTVLALAACLFALSACGPTKSQAEVPTVNTILVKYVNALGGRAAISDLTTRTSKGTLELVGQTEQGTAASYSKAPNKYLSVITVPTYGEIRRGYDGHAGWIKDRQSPAEDLTGEELAHARRGAEFYISVKIPDLYPNLVLKGQEDVNGHPAYLVESDLGSGSLVRMYFDVASGLLVREDEDSTTPTGRDLFQAYFDDYRNVQGVKYPFKVRQVHGPTTFIVHLDQIQVNQPIDDAMFNKPTK